MLKPKKFGLFGKKQPVSEAVSREKTRTEKSYDLFKDLFERDPFNETIIGTLKDQISSGDAVKLSFLFYLFVCEMTDYVTIDMNTMNKKVIFELSKIKRNKKKIREAVLQRMGYIYSIQVNDPYLSFLKLDNDQSLDIKYLEVIQDGLFKEDNDVLPVEVIADMIIKTLGHV